MSEAGLAVSWPDWLEICAQRYGYTDDAKLREEGSRCPGTNYRCWWCQRPDLVICIAVDDATVRRVQGKGLAIATMIASAISRKVLDEMLADCALGHGYKWPDDVRQKMGVWSTQPIERQAECLQSANWEYALGLTDEQIDTVVAVFREWRKCTAELQGNIGVMTNGPRDISLRLGLCK